MLSYLFLRSKSLWPACRCKFSISLQDTRHEEEGHEDPQVEAASRFIIANSGRQDEGVSTFQEEGEQKAGAVSSTSRASGVLFFSRDEGVMVFERKVGISLRTS